MKFVLFFPIIIILSAILMSTTPDTMSSTFENAHATSFHDFKINIIYEKK